MTVRVQMNRLKPDTTYYYRVESVIHGSQPAWIKSEGTSGQAAPIGPDYIGSSSCTGPSRRGGTADCVSAN